MLEKTTISITQELRKRLQLLAVQHDITYQKLIEDLLYTYEAEQPFRSEKEFAIWFEGNFDNFGFEKILQKNKHISPDYIMEDFFGEIVSVELELIDKNFVSHKPQMDKIDFDYIVCAYGTKEEVLGVPVLSLKRKTPWKKKLMLEITDELWNGFKKTVFHDQTLNEAIVEMIQRRVDTWRVEKK